jgi:hypothetical protein
MANLNDDGHFGLQALHDERERQRNDEVNHGGKGIHLYQPIVAIRDFRRCAEEIGNRKSRTRARYPETG